MPSLLGLSFHKKKTHSSSQVNLVAAAQEQSHEKGKHVEQYFGSHHHYGNHTAVTAVTASGPVQTVTGTSAQITPHTSEASGANDPHQHMHSQQHKLTRFFRPSMKKRPSGGSTMSSTKLTDLISPDHTNNWDHNSHTQSFIPPSTDSTLSLSNKTNIYHDDSILAQKYGKLGKLLGSGAGGSVKVLVRPTDGAMFAVKQFRSRKPNEPIRDYARKCTSEFCVGSMLHHPNIIETLDIFSDAKQTQYYEVMEYCPVDFFAVVMSGDMSRGEINCCFRQLVEGVNYLHSKGYAHRDLKLDNCVMTKDGILKLIDFGSAFVYKYTYENDTKLAHGIVGSDPYLAPEVLTHTNGYDAPKVDIWSMGIIFCCMMLKRFPWKVPKDSDVNFHLYSMPDDVEHDYVKSAQEHEELMKAKREERQKMKQIKSSKEQATEQSAVNEQHHDGSGAVAAVGCDGTDVHDENRDNASVPEDGSEHNTAPVIKEDHKVQSDEKQDIKQVGSISERHQHQHQASEPSSSEHDASQKKQKKVIHGPYRLLRLLPHASRPIMSKILCVDPDNRATMKDIYSDHWFLNISYCTMDDKKNVIRGTGHSHTIILEEDGQMKKYKV